MNRGAYYLSIAVLLSIGALLAFFLVPSENEMALFHEKDHLFQKATHRYQELWDQGKHQASVAIPLSNLYLQDGKVGDAIELMESFVIENLPSVEARVFLGKLYLYDQRTQEYVDNLVEIQRLRPSLDNLKELSKVHNFNADYSKQKRVLQNMVANHPYEEQSVWDLAYLYTMEGDNLGAIYVLEQVVLSQKNVPNIDVVEFYISLMIDEDMTKKALDSAKSYLDRNGSVKNALQLAGRFQLREANKEALELLLPFVVAKQEHPEIWAILVSLEMALGEKKPLFRELKKVFLEGKLPVLLMEDFVKLALEFGSSGFHEYVLREAPRNTLSTKALVAFARTGFLTQNNSLRRLLRMRLSFRAARNMPLLQALLALDEGNAGKVIETLLSSTNLSLENIIMMAEICLDSGFLAPARTLLMSTPSQKHVLEDESLLLAKLFIEAGVPEYGLIFFSKFIDSGEQRYINQLQYSWMLLALVLDKEEEALAWLKGHSIKEIGTDLLFDIYHASIEHDQLRVAYRVAREVYTRNEKSLESESNLVFVLGLLILSKTDALQWRSELRPLLLGRYKVADSLDTQVILLRQIYEMGFEKEFREIFPSLIQSENPINGLEKMAKLAYELGETESYQRILTKLLSVDNRNAYALKSLGILNYGMARYAGAGRYFAAYFDTDSSDYLSNYYYAGTLVKLDTPKRAPVHYSAALAQIKTMRSKDSESLGILPQIWSKTGKKENANRAYLRAIDLEPTNLDFCLDYFHFLLDEGWLKEAGAVWGKCPRMHLNKKSNRLLKLAQARLLFEQGDKNQAQGLLKSLKAEKSGTKINSLIAQNAFQMGRTRRALSILTAALKQDLMNEDMKALKEQMESEEGHFIRTELEMNTVGNLRLDLVSRTQVRAAIRPFIHFGLDYEIRRSSFEGFVRSKDGVFTDYSGYRYQASAYAQYQFDRGDLAKASLYLTQLSPGLGGQYQMWHGLGSTGISLDYHRPYLASPETIAQLALVDQLLLYNRFLFGWNIPLNISVGFNRYRLGKESGVAKSIQVGAEVGFSFRVRRPRHFLKTAPWLGFWYALDAEYVLENAKRKDFKGNTFQPFPVSDRETHMVGLTFRQLLPGDLDVSALLGAAFSRVAREVGPVGNISISKRVLDDLDLSASFERAIGTSLGDYALNSFKVGMKWRF